MLERQRLSVLLLPVLLPLSLLSTGQPLVKTQTPTVVYDSGRTVDATPYFSRQRLSRETPKKLPPMPIAPAQPAHSLELADRLPLRTQQLKPGPLTVYEIKGLVMPFFVIGMDRQSLDWLEDASDTLAAMHATGIVVEVSNRDAWLALQAKAAQRRIRLSLLNGDSLATTYAFTTYPAVFMPEDLTQ